MNVFMKAKKFLATTLAAMMLALAPATGIGSSLAPSLGLHGPSVAYAAKGGARLAPSAPKTAPAAPKATSPDTHKSVSGNGGSYAPSKNAKDLEKNAPAASNKAGTAANAANSTQNSSRLGSILRGVGLLAGGMFLGSMLGSLFGLGGGLFSDVLGLLMNVVIFAAAFFLIRALVRRFLGKKNETQGGAWSQQNASQQPYQQPLHTAQADAHRTIDITPTESSSSLHGGDAKSIADRYRNR